MDNNELINDFIEDIRLRGWSKWTIKSCQYSLDLLVECLNGIPFQDVEAKQLKQFLVYLKDRKGRNGKISLETIRKHINNLSSFYEYLEDEEIISKSPVPKFRRKYVTKGIRDESTQQRQLLNLKQMRRLIGSVIDPHDKAMMIILAKTGIRAQELISIDISDVSLDDLTVNIKPTGKRKQMKVYFDFETKRVLNHWMKLRKDVKSIDNNALFLTRNGSRISYTILNKRVTNYAALLGYHDPSSNDLEKKFTPHCFRHFFTTELINSGMDKDYVKELRGDSRSETIDIYYHITPEELKREYLQHIPSFNLS